MSHPNIQTALRERLLKKKRAALVEYALIVTAAADGKNAPDMDVLIDAMDVLGVDQGAFDHDVAVLTQLRTHERSILDTHGRKKLARLNTDAAAAIAVYEKERVEAPARLQRLFAAWSTLNDRAHQLTADESRAKQHDIPELRKRNPRAFGEMSDGQLLGEAEPPAPIGHHDGGSGMRSGAMIYH